MDFDQPSTSAHAQPLRVGFTRHPVSLCMARKDPVPMIAPFLEERDREGRQQIRTPRSPLHNLDQI